MPTPITRTLVANRGEIAVRIVHACQALGIETVVAVSEADRDGLAARIADRAVCIGPARSSESYLDPARIVAAALGTGCDAVHPGYGFLAESPALADQCAEAGLTFVGPQAAIMRLMGDKVSARRVAEQAGVPTLPGTERITSALDAAAAADAVGYPVLLKASAGGGGRGMMLVHEAAQFADSFARASSEAREAFGDDSLYLERYVPRARHIEVQVLADRHGNVIHVGDRDCSSQRRHQKLVEEGPAPGLDDAVRQQIHDAAIRLAKTVEYEGAGTMEFLFDADRNEFYFLEMNTRIQVEHPVSELISGIDLVAEQFRIAAGQPLRVGQQDVQLRGHAIECRITAEIPELGFRPNAGRITTWRPPDWPFVRVDTHCFAGYTVPIFYDSLLAKLIAYAPTRDEARERLHAALGRFEVDGIQTNIAFARYLIERPEFVAGEVTTALVDRVVAEYAQGRVEG
jgi:acetyl-CoA carboxylase biotin carboxylase subunit